MEEPIMGKQVAADEPQRPQGHGQEHILREPIELAKRAFQEASNLQWDKAQQLNQEAQAKAQALEGREGELVRGLLSALTAMTDSFAMQVRDTDPGRFQRAGQKLEEARGHLERLRQR